MTSTTKEPRRYGQTFHGSESVFLRLASRSVNFLESGLPQPAPILHHLGVVTGKARIAATARTVTGHLSSQVLKRPRFRPRLAPGLLLRTTYLRRYRSKLRGSSFSLGPAVTDKERPSTSVLANNPPLDEIVLPVKRRNLPRTVLPVISSSGSDA